MQLFNFAEKSPTSLGGGFRIILISGVSIRL